MRKPIILYFLFASLYCKAIPVDTLSVANKQMYIGKVDIQNSSIDSLFATNIAKMEMLLGNKNSLQIIPKKNIDDSLWKFLMFINEVTHYCIWYPNLKNYLFRIDVDYIKNWYNKYQNKLSLEIISTIYRMDDYSLLLKLSTEEFDALEEHNIKQCKEFRKFIYGFDY